MAVGGVAMETRAISVSRDLWSRFKFVNAKATTNVEGKVIFKVEGKATTNVEGKVAFKMEGNMAIKLEGLMTEKFEGRRKV